MAKAKPRPRGRPRQYPEGVVIYARADRELLRAIDERAAQESDRFGAKLTRSDVVRAILTRVLLPRD